MANRFQVLIQHLAEGIEKDYRDAQQHAREHDAQRAGHEGESTWVRLLEQWGPGWPIVTRRYIVGPGGESNEVDVVMLKPDYPKHLRDEPSVLVSGVAAAFSSKLTLRTGHLREAIQQKARLYEVAGRPNSSPKEALCGPFPFGLLAHSTEISPKADDPAEALLQTYERLAHQPGESLVSGPAGELDALLVADRCFLNTTRVALSPRGTGAQVDAWQPSTSFNRPAESVDHPGAPLAQFIVWVHTKCGGSSLGALAAMFKAEGQQGYATHWPLETYRDHTRENWRKLLLNEYGNPLVF